MELAKNLDLNVSYRLGLTFFLLSGLLSCGYGSQSSFNNINFRFGINVTPIGSLQRQQENSTVYIQGKVDSSVPLLQQRAYQLNDSTGKIWVITNQTNIKETDQLMIKGKLRYKSIPLAEKEFGEIYLEEEQQLEHKSGK